MINLNLEGKTALVCGSTQGIGWACAKEMAHLGARIFLLARDESKLQQCMKQLPSGDHDYRVADFQNPDSVNEAVQSITSTGTTIHILVNNTGGPAAGLAVNATIQEFTNAFQAHLVCNHLLAQAVIPGMKAANYGRIINIISTSVKVPLAGLGVSNTIRGAVASWSKTLANELGSFGITVNNVLPGATKTARLDAIFSNKTAKLQKSIPAIEEEMLTEIPAARFAEPEEIASAVCFLASGAASYINGINLPVDGGRTGCL